MSLDDWSEWDDLSLMEHLEEANNRIRIKLSDFQAAGVPTGEMVFVSDLNLLTVGYFQGLKQEAAAYRLWLEGSVTEDGTSKLLQAARNRRLNLATRLEGLDPPQSCSPLLTHALATIKKLEEGLRELDYTDKSPMGKVFRAETLLSEGTDLLLQVLELNRSVKATIKNRLSDHNRKTVGEG